LSVANDRIAVCTLSRMLRRLSGVSAILFDVDGTLIDSNRAHAEAWAQALTEHGFPHEADQIRPFIGMGSDKLLPAIARMDVESPRGKAILARKKTLFDERLPRLRPTRGARALLTFLRERGKTLVVATSADDEEMHAILQQAGVADLMPRRTSSDDAARSKPDPDIVRAALSRAGTTASAAVMIGDTPYDVEAAARAGVDCIAVRCGGWWQDPDLSGAVAIAEDPRELYERWH
jgi:HAD superfamily hydrolase (TIGR01509 family)